MPVHGRAQHGFTLIEQILTLAVVAVLTSIAIPSMRGLLHHEHLRVATGDITEAIRDTRMLAIERQRRAVLCPSIDGRHCDRGGAWASGWLIAIDSDHDGQPDSTPIVTHPAMAGVRIRASRGRSRIYYHPNGSAPGSNLTLRICPRGKLPDTVDAVVVSNSGRIRQARVKASGCP